MRLLPLAMLVIAAVFLLSFLVLRSKVRERSLVTAGIERLSADEDGNSRVGIIVTNVAARPLKFWWWPPVYRDQDVWQATSRPIGGASFELSPGAHSNALEVSVPYDAAVWGIELGAVPSEISRIERAFARLMIVLRLRPSSFSGEMNTFLEIRGTNVVVRRVRSGPENIRDRL